MWWNMCSNSIEKTQLFWCLCILVKRHGWRFFVHCLFFHMESLFGNNIFFGVRVLNVRCQVVVPMTSGLDLKAIGLDCEIFVGFDYWIRLWDGWVIEAGIRLFYKGVWSDTERTVSKTVRFCEVSWCIQSWALYTHKHTRISAAFWPNIWCCSTTFLNVHT